MESAYAVLLVLSVMTLFQTVVGVLILFDHVKRRRAHVGVQTDIPAYVLRVVVHPNGTVEECRVAAA